MMRTTLGLLVLGLAAWALVAVFSEPPPAAQPTTWTSSLQCLECHAEVGAEWQESWHSQSWTDPLVRAPDQSNDFANTDCIDCHAPRGIFETGIGQRVLPRNVRQVEGVDCLTCHLLPDGRVAGTIDRPSAPCRPVARRELRDPQLCAGCHNQHGTVDQWRASDYPAQNIGCLECHMPALQRADGKPGRDHRMHGGHSLAELQKATALSARVEDGAWRARVANVGAGHNYPTDERSRASDLFWRPAESSDEPAWQHVYRFRNPYRFEVDQPNTELAAHAALDLVLEGADVDQPIELLLAYKLTPVWDDPEHPDPEHDSTSTVVHRQVFRP